MYGYARRTAGPAGAHILADNNALHGDVLELFGEIFAGQQRCRRRSELISTAFL
jgi:hypothetical protein